MDFDMDKIVLISTLDYCDDRKSPSIWYTVVHESITELERAHINPWNQEEAVCHEQRYLMDDCVISIRPARYESRLDRQQDQSRGCYFIEIANQNSTRVFSSRSVYSWD